jgi:glycosyltransferase involved in cell wall biosynthesis
MRSGSGSRLRVLVIAYQFSPVLGSEFKAAWKMVHELSKYCEITVLFGDSDGLMGSTEFFDHYALSHQLPFRYFKVPAAPWQVYWAKRMTSMPLGLLFWILVKAWMRDAYKLACTLHQENPFDVAHQLGPIGFRNPGYLWKLNCRTIWGPIGGAQFINLRMIKNVRVNYFWEALIRNLITYYQGNSKYIRDAAIKYDGLSFANFENRTYFQKRFRRDGAVISEQGLEFAPGNLASSPTTHVQASRSLRVIWAGTLRGVKNTPMLCDILQSSHPNIDFIVLGDGPDAPMVKHIANVQSNVKYLGFLPRNELMELFSKSDLIMMTDLTAGNPAVLFEAIESGCVPLVPNIHGFASLLRPEVAFLVESTHYKDAVRQYTEILRQISSDITLLDRKKSALAIHQKSLTWESFARLHLANYFS